MNQEYPQQHLQKHSATIRVTLAALFLFLGTLVYLSARPPGSAYLIPHLAITVPPAWHAWLGFVTGPLPTFAHTIAFVLLSAVFARPERSAMLHVCGLWFAIETLLEVGQAAPAALHIAALLPAWFNQVPVLDHVAAYFLRGTFDPLDLVAAGSGVVAAYLILQYILGKEACHER
jgi:hypothetical protein